MMQKAQVFSLERNTSVRNRLTHSLEVADVGRTIAYKVGRLLEARGKASADDTDCMVAIVENACLIHDIGNPPFGHFGEEAIKRWFHETAPNLFERKQESLPLGYEDPRFYDFIHFDGNPQGFRIVTSLHTERDHFGLNLTHATLLSTIKYPHVTKLDPARSHSKKLGVFSSEAEIYKSICAETNHTSGTRYFMVYLMELADDICYCLSDIADAFEKKVIDSRLFKEEFKKICSEDGVYDLVKSLIPDHPVESFSHEIAIEVSRKCVIDGTAFFAEHLDSFIHGEGKELIDIVDMGRVLKCFKKFARRFIYTSPEAQQIEIAGYRIVHDLLDHYGSLLMVPKEDFAHFVIKKEMREHSDLDIEWRLFNQLSKRMVKSYHHNLRKKNETEWFERCRLLVDYISGMTDQSALRFYQNVKGISLDS